MKLIFLVISSLLVACSTTPKPPKERFDNIKWKFHPDPRTILTKAGDEVVFEITPNLRHKYLRVYYGDRDDKNEEIYEDISLSEINELCFSDNNCKPFHKRHIYTKGKAYYPYIVYKDNMKKRIPLDKDELKIIIARKEIKEDEEIEQLAMDDFTQKFAHFILNSCNKPEKERKACNEDYKFLSVSMLKDANFESIKYQGKEHSLRLIKNAGIPGHF